MRHSPIGAWLLLMALPANGEELALAAPSPDWRDQIIYFLMIDRFEDGDPGNNLQGQGEFDPADGARYSGGDLAGIARHLDYIQGLGATAIWITPPVAHKWWDAQKRYGGYHGYWAENFKAVDAHFGTLEDYRRLSDQIHGKGMYLIQDIVVNHTANYFSMAPGSDPKDPGKGYVLHPAAGGRRAPTQAPFTPNDPRKARDRAAAIYHWTPEIVDFADPKQVHDWQLAGLDDLNTENPVVRAALRDSYGYWIDAVGVDGYRVDTAFYVPEEFFEDFLYSNDKLTPGIDRVARKNGRDAFHVFGEGFAIDGAFDETQARRIDAYMRGPEGQRRMPGMLNFPLYGTGVDVFARGRPTAELAFRIESLLRVHAQPWLLPSFVDNHDVDRFLAGGSQRALEQNLLLIMTLPGIPTIYYGTEQGFTEQRGAMFASGYRSGGKSHFDGEAPLYRFIQRISALRRAHRVFSRGTPAVLARNAAGPGALAYAMRHGDDTALVLFNTADSPVLVDHLDSGLAPGTRLAPLFAIDGEAPALQIDADGRLSLELPARSGLAWEAQAAVAIPPQVDSELTIDPLAAAVVHGDLELSGHAGADEQFVLVVNGALATAQAVIADAEGQWHASLDTRALLDARIEQQVVAWSPARKQASARAGFRVERTWTVLAEKDDPRGDDTGPTGKYTYPSDPSFGDHHQLDLTGARVLGSGGALQLEVRMRELTRSWNPPSGFDHVAFSIFIELPGEPGGATALPFQNASMPDGMHWHRRLRVHGWSNALFSSDGASATADGRALTPTAALEVDRDQHCVRFLLPPASLGSRASLSGSKIYITTWDYDASYKTLEPGIGHHGFGGGDGKTDPLVMDALVIELP